MRLGCSGVAPVLLLQKNVLRRQDMVVVGKVILPVIFRPRADQLCHIGLHVVEGCGLKLLRRCVLPEFPI